MCERMLFIRRMKVRHNESPTQYLLANMTNELSTHEADCRKSSQPLLMYKMRRYDTPLPTQCQKSRRVALNRYNCQITSLTGPLLEQIAAAAPAVQHQTPFQPLSCTKAPSLMSVKSMTGLGPHKGTVNLMTGLGPHNSSQYNGYDPQNAPKQICNCALYVVITSHSPLTCEKRLHAYAAKRQALITQVYHKQSPLSSSNESAVKCSICT